MSTAESPRGRLDAALANARRLVAPFLAQGDAPTVVGVSGGADSLALAAAVGFHVRRGVSARAVVVDHQLQPESAAVAARAAAACEELGLPARVTRVDVTGGGGPEAAARRARLDALGSAAGPGGTVLLAHTLDDQAETVLLGLGRGSGARSLRAMAEVTPTTTGRIARPFLGLRRIDTERICRALELPWWDDPHNADPAFRRVRVRSELLPLMEDVLGGGVAEALARTAGQLRADDAALSSWADSLGADPALDALAGAPVAVRSRALRRLAVEAGASAGELTAAHVAALDRLALGPRRPARIELPGRITATVVGNRLAFIPTTVRP